MASHVSAATLCYMSGDSSLISDLLLQGLWVALCCTHTSPYEGQLSSGHAENHDCLFKATGGSSRKTGIFLWKWLFGRAPEKLLEVRSDPIRAEEQSGFLLQPLYSTFTFRASVEPKDPLAQPCHAKSQGQSMGSQGGLFPEQQHTWEPCNKAPSQPSFLVAHGSVRQVTTKLGLLILPVAWPNTSSSKGCPTVLLLARWNVHF